MAAGSRGDEEAPFEGGSQPVREHRAETAGPGRTIMQAVVLVIGILVVLAALMWILVLT